MQKKEYEFVVILVVYYLLWNNSLKILRYGSYLLNYEWTGNYFLWWWFRNYSFQDQIMRASISISIILLNEMIDEVRKDFIKFLTIAKSSAAEVRNMIYFAFWVEVY